jgi:hypothetical protein
MRKRKIILLALSAVILIAISLTIGFLYGFRQGIRAGGLTRSGLEFMKAEEYMLAQFSNADCEGVKVALKDYLALLEKYKNAEGFLISGKGYYIDVMLVHTRLARIAKGLHNEPEAQNHFKLALEACAQTNWKECSEDKLIQFTRRSEEKNPIACLKKLEK